jgi:hypothetical protein
MESSRERVISVVLTEQEWQAFVRVQPQPVAFLRAKIQESIARAPISSGFVPATGAGNTTSATTR